MYAGCDGNGTISTKLAYSPFGGKTSGTELPFGFSTKPVDASGFVYYGFRFYNAQIGRWLTRDPIDENGSVNLYQSCRNNLVDDYDYLGLKDEESYTGSLTGYVETLFARKEIGGYFPDVKVDYDASKTTTEDEKVTADLTCASKCRISFTLKAVFILKVDNDKTYAFTWIPKTAQDKADFKKYKKGYDKLIKIVQDHEKGHQDVAHDLFKKWEEQFKNPISYKLSVCQEDFKKAIDGVLANKKTELTNEYDNAMNTYHDKFGRTITNIVDVIMLEANPTWEK